MDQSTNKTTSESDFTSSVCEKLCYSGSCAVHLATNHSMGYTQYVMTSTLFTDVVCFKVQCLKSLLNCFYTFVKSWWINIHHLFSAKRHSHKVKSKFSSWMNFPQHKRWVGDVRPHHLRAIHPFHLLITFNTLLTVTWRSGTCWQLKGIGKCWSQPKWGRGKQWNDRNLSTL